MVHRGAARRACAATVSLICALCAGGMPAGARAAAADEQPVAVGQPAARSPAGYTFVRSLGGIDEYRLDSNGLTVLLAPDHSAPVVTFQVTYRVGSRNEVTGTTGATHILEH